MLRQRREREMKAQNPSTERRVALFIDYLNGGGLDMAGVVRRARRLGQIEVAWAYGRFYCRSHRLSQRAEDLRRLGVRLFHCPDPNTGPGDVTDAAMMQDIFVTLHERPEIDCYVLCTADGDFVNVLTGIRVLDREAVVIGPANRTAKALRKEAHRFMNAPYLSKGQKNGRQHSGPNGRSRMAGKNGSD
jgi:hypothetical protein